MFCQITGKTQVSSSVKMSKLVWLKQDNAGTQDDKRQDACGEEAWSLQTVHFKRGRARF